MQNKKEPWLKANLDIIVLVIFILCILTAVLIIPEGAYTATVILCIIAAASFITSVALIFSDKD